MVTNKTMETPVLGGKYLTFALGQEEYGLEVLSVREIFGYVECTPVPHTPRHVCGVMNLRGQVISVVDLRTRFGMPTIGRTDQTCIIVVEIKNAGRPVNVGIVVDRVLEVLAIPITAIEDAPSFGGGFDLGFVLGMAKVGGGVKILLNIDKCLTSTDAIHLAPETAAA